MSRSRPVAQKWFFATGTIVAAVVAGKPALAPLAIAAGFAVMLTPAVAAVGPGELVAQLPAHWQAVRPWARPRTTVLRVPQRCCDTTNATPLRRSLTDSGDGENPIGRVDRLCRSLIPCALPDWYRGLDCQVAARARVDVRSPAPQVDGSG